MKKFLVLTLVLGIASLASAALSWTPANPAAAAGTITLVTDAAISAYDVSFMVTSGDAALDASAIVPGLVFDFATAAAIDTAQEARITASQFLSGPVGPGGLFEDLKYSATVESTIDVVDQLNQGRVLGTISIVPEPATMALLGLGALVLRRKK